MESRNYGSTLIRLFKTLKRRVERNPVKEQAECLRLINQAIKEMEEAESAWEIKTIARYKYELIQPLMWTE